MMLAAGNDMFMIPGYYGYRYVEDIIDCFKNVTNDGNVTEDRINDAVARILSVKMALGLVTLAQEDGIMERVNELFKTFTSEISKLFKINLTEKKKEEAKKPVTDEKEYQDSLTAVHESLVLLKNSGVLPVKSSFLEYVVLVGERTININQLSTY